VTRVGINGFGRMGRLALRAAAGWPEFEFALVNETAGDAATGAHLLEFDSVHGRWSRGIEAHDDALVIEGHEVAWSSAPSPGEAPWEAAGVELVLECSGRFRTIDSLAPYFERGVRKVVVAAPVKEQGALNVVVGVNDDPAELARHDIVTAASCTTNCLAPVVKVLHEGIGIEHGWEAAGVEPFADSHDHGLGHGDRADLPRAAGQAQRVGRSGAVAERIADRLRLRGRAPDHHRGDQPPAEGGGRRSARRDPRL
jgi:glyceraldehyde-3-phosphate dehydrogenase/erythrose-4-phosphate dehydrogenase